MTDIIYQYKDNCFVLSDILELYPDSSINMEQYQYRVNCRKAGLKLFDQVSINSAVYEFQLGDIKRASLKEDSIYCDSVYKYHFVFDHLFPLAFHGTGGVSHAVLKKAKVFSNGKTLTARSQITFDEYGQIISFKSNFDGQCYLKNRKPKINDIMKYLNAGDSLSDTEREAGGIEDEMFSYLHLDNCELTRFIDTDATKYRGYYRREGNRFGSYPGHDMYNDDDDPYFPLVDK